MAYFAEIDGHVASLRTVLAAVDDAERLPSIIHGLGDADAMRVIADSAAVIQAMQRAQVVAAGVIAARSTRTAGHAGLAQSRGHRNPASLLQELTGSTRSTAVKSIRLGESLLAVATGGGADDADPAVDSGATAHIGAAAPAPWHAPLGAALLAGALSTDQHHAIMRGLGEPPHARTFLGDPLVDADAGPLDDEAIARLEADRAEADLAVREAWSLAAEQLVLEAAVRTVEELAGSARAIRDRLDPEGAAERYAARFDQRSFRLYSNHDGTTMTHIVFDDEGAAWIRAVRDAALRPRRGGPRFVDSDEQERADRLRDDDRTDDQLTYDLMLDVMRAGALAEADDVFGTRQAGVRMVTVIDAMPGVRATVAHLEEDGATLPVAVAEQIACTAGAVPVSVDRHGDPLSLGRMQRLFTPAQRLALAVRDGGCRWRGCDRVASYCEAHHIDPWQHGGRTDVDRGILLCRYHHMQLHHNRWRITRDHLDDFVLHPPGAGAPIPLPPRLSLTRAWSGIDPPLRRWRTPGDPLGDRSAQTTHAVRSGTCTGM